MRTSKSYKYLPLILGIVSFIIYLTLFHQFEKSKPLLLVISKLVTNACFMAFALIGANDNPSLRNQNKPCAYVLNVNSYQELDNY